MDDTADKDFSSFSPNKKLVAVRNHNPSSQTNHGLPEKKATTALLSHRITPRETLEFQIARIGSNNLIEIATPLLALAVRIRDMDEIEDIARLHAQVENEIRGFAKEVENQGYDSASILGARYCMCAMIDESVLSQIWGAESQWPMRPMLSIFHNETWGGEKFFTILDRVFDESHRFQDLLRFLYLCMALGFEGKYHVMHNGQQKLEALMTRAVELVEKNNGPIPDKFINPEPNIHVQAQRLRKQVPIALIATGAAMLLVVIFVFFHNAINVRVDLLQSEVRAVLERSSHSVDLKK